MPREILGIAKVTLTGVTRMLHNKCDLEDDTGGEAKGKKSKKSYDLEWRKMCHTSMNGSGTLIVPSLNIEAMMREGSVNYKTSSGNTALKKVVVTGTAVEEFEIPIMLDGANITIDDVAENNWLFQHPVVINNSRVLKKWAAIPVGWKIEFHVNIFNELITFPTLRSLFDRCGYEQGLMNWRPSSPKKPGKFGQFELEKFEIIKNMEVKEKKKEKKQGRKKKEEKE